MTEQSDLLTKRKRNLTLLAILFLSIALIYLTYWLLYGRFYETTDDAYVSGNLILVMPQTSGYVTGIYADVTDLVKEGDPLVTLDVADAEVALKNAEAGLALTVRQTFDLYSRVEQLRATVLVQQDNYEKAQEDYKRRYSLVVNKTISQEDLQHAKIEQDSALASLTLAKHQLANSIALVNNSDLYHHPQVSQAAAILRSAYLAKQRTIIYAPETGYIAKRTVEVGEQINPQTVLMVLVPLNEVWVDANFKESQIKNFRIGQPAELISDSYGSDIKYHGKVVGLNPGAGSAFDLLPAQNATGNWIKIVQRLPVRIQIDSNQLKKHPLRIGLSMDVSVDLHNRQGEVLSHLPKDKLIYKSKSYSSDLEKAEELINKILQDNAKNISFKAE